MGDSRSCQLTRMHQGVTMGRMDHQQEHMLDRRFHSIPTETKVDAVNMDGADGVDGTMADQVISGIGTGRGRTRGSAKFGPGTLYAPGGMEYSTTRQVSTCSGTAILTESYNSETGNLLMQQGMARLLPLTRCAQA